MHFGHQNKSKSFSLIDSIPLEKYRLLKDSNRKWFNGHTTITINALYIGLEIGLVKGTKENEKCAHKTVITFKRKRNSESDGTRRGRQI